MATAVAVAIIWFARPERKENRQQLPPVSDVRKGEEPVGWSAGNRIVGYKPGQAEPQFELEIELIETYAERDAIHFRNLTEGVINRADGPDLYIRGGSGAYNKKTGDFEVHGDLQVYEGGELMLKASTLHWSSADGRLTSPQAVWFRHGGVEIEAGDMVFDPGEQVALFGGGVMVRGMAGGTETSVPRERRFVGRFAVLTYYIDEERATSNSFGRISIDLSNGR